MSDNIQINPIYESLTQTINGNWNLSTYARQQKEQRIEASKLPPDQQQQRLVEIFNNRPQFSNETPKNQKKQISGYQHNPVKTKSLLGVINPEHKYSDPRVSMKIKQVQAEEWFQSRYEQTFQKTPQTSSKKNLRAQSAKVQDPQLDHQFEIQVKKIEIKPPSMLEKEKPLMQDHLVSPYIYIQKILKKNSEEVNIKHPDIWDKSTNRKSNRLNRQQSASKKQSEKTLKNESKQDKEQQKLEKEERRQFYLKNLKMKDFIFKFYKTVNKLLKERHFNKVIYQGNQEEYDLNTLFKLWAKHKQVVLHEKMNPQQFVTKEEFCDFMLVIGLNPEKLNEAEQFFNYCHEMVPASSKESAKVNEKGVIVPKWWKMFEEEKKDEKDKIKVDFKTEDNTKDEILKEERQKNLMAYLGIQQINQ